MIPPISLGHILSIGQEAYSIIKILSFNNNLFNVGVQITPAIWLYNIQHFKTTLIDRFRLKLTLSKKHYKINIQ